MPGVETASRICRCVCRTRTLAADATSMHGIPGRTAVLRFPRRLGPHHHLHAWTLCSPSNTAPLPAYTPPVVGVPRRKPPRAANDVHRDRFTTPGWTPGLPPWWLPALDALSAADSRPHALLVGCVPSISCGWGRTGAWTAPRYCRLPERCGNPLGWVRLRVSPAPAGLTAVILRRLRAVCRLPRNSMNFRFGPDCRIRPRRQWRISMDSDCKSNHHG